MFLKRLPLLLCMTGAAVIAADETPAPKEAAPLPEASAPAAAPKQAPPPDSAAAPAADAGKPVPPTEPAPAAELLPSLLPDQILPPQVAPRRPKAAAARVPGSTLRPPTTALDLDMRIRYLKARNIAEADPGVREAWQSSRAAKTDYEKREALKRYYGALYRRMLAIDRGIAPLVEERKRDQVVSLEQLRITPTVPLR